jgi:ribose 5-phosphate isomerase
MTRPWANASGVYSSASTAYTETAKLSQQEGIPLLTLADAAILDVTVGGADEADAVEQWTPSTQLNPGHCRI